jgi:cation transport ATPase
MHARFAQSSVLAVAGGFIVVASQAFTTAQTAWLAFAIGAGALVLAAVPVVAGVRDRALVLDGIIGLLAAWTIVASLIFAGSTVLWLSFGEGAALAALGLVGLTLDHLALSRSAHAVAGVPRDAVVTVDRPSAVAA